MLKPALGDEVANVLGQYMYSLSGLLCNIWSSSSLCAQKSSSDFILLPMASRKAWGVFMLSSVRVPLSIKVWKAFLSLPSNMSLEVLPTLMMIISLLSLDVQGIQIMKSPDVEGSPVLRPVRGVKVECWGFPVVVMRP